jgi:uncharacterized protein (TIGR03067 family)
MTTPDRNSNEGQLMLRVGLVWHGRAMALAVLSALGSMSIATPGFAGDVVSLDELQGTWRQVSGEFWVQPLPEKPTTFVVVGDAYTEAESTITSTTLAIDDTRSPVTYEESVHFRQPNAFKFPGILKVSGSQLVRSFGDPNAERPSTFESKTGDRIHVETWEREGACPPPDSPIARQLEGRWRLVTRVDNGRPYDVLGRGSRMEISGTTGVRTDTIMRSGRLVLEQGSNRVFLDETNRVVIDPANLSTRLAGLIDFDPKEQTLRLCVNVHRQSTTPLAFDTGPDNFNRLRVFKKEKDAKDSRPR